MTDILHSLDSRFFGRDSADNFVSKGNIIIPDAQKIYRNVATVSVTSAQILALNATAIPVVAAPGANLAIVPYLTVLKHSGGTAYAGIATGEDWVLKYTNASGAQISGVIETTGFLDQTSAQIRIVGRPGSTGSTAGDIAPVANAAIVLHQLVGEIITGNFPVLVRVFYDVIDTSFTG